MVKKMKIRKEHLNGENRAKDLEEITEINKVLKKWNIIYCPWHKKNRIEQSMDTTYVAEIQGSTVGAMTLTDCGDRYLGIESIAVKEENQGQGIGSELISFAEEHAKSEEFKHLIVFSYVAYKNENFYLKHGFDKSNEIRRVGPNRYLTFTKKVS